MFLKDGKVLYSSEVSKTKKKKKKIRGKIEIILNTLNYF
jgi:hypothetical protein